MQPKQLRLASQTIAYYESAGTGPAILLIHGNSASGRAYQRQLESTLAERHRIVALDLPGHGDSEPFADPSAYSIPGYAAIVVEAAKALGMEEAVIVGWSLGGHIVLETHDQLPSARGMMIFGTPPLAFPPAMEEAFLPNPAVNVGFQAEVSEEDARAYAASFFASDTPAPTVPFVEDILRTDGRARSGLAASIQPNGYQDEVEIVAHLTTPLAVIHGKEEKLVNEAYIRNLTMPTLWRSAIQIIDDAGHAPQWEQPEAFNALLEAFCAHPQER
jgi:pimeloyl-ACP methyl ester carboxylesterase